jgi:hypothetical protein
MRPDIRRLIACTLLMLVPLQAMATVAARSCAAGMANCCEMPADNMDCRAGAMAAEPTQSPTTHQDDQGQSQNSCSMGACCAAMCQLLTLPAALPIPFRGGLAILAAAFSSHFLSFIPEGLQRPPSILA